MHLQLIDWIIVAVILLICFVPALFFGKRAGKSTSEFFASGRAVPWWLAGLSMVATTFSSDTPNLVTDIVRRNGVAGQLGLVGLHPDRRRHGLLLRPAVAAVRGHDRPRVLRDPLFGQGRRRRPRLPLGLPRLLLQLHHHGHGQPGRLQDRRRPLRPAPLADAALRRRAQRGLRRALRAVGRPGHRHDPVLHQDDGRHRRRLLRRQAPSAACRRWSPTLSAKAGPGGINYPEHAARLQEQLGHGRGRLHHAHRRPVVGGLVSRRRAGRRQLHRPAHAGLEIGEGLARRGPLLQHRPLRPPALAVDPRRPLLAHRLSRSSPTSRRPSPTSTRACSATTSPTRPCSSSCPSASSA